MNSSQPQPQSETLFGHPAGLFTLFFAEMWERFSYYGMRALLVFYMIKGFLGYGDKDAYAVYGAYTALVYMTPFFGGLLADRLLGARRAVILGGLLMAAGHLMMTVETSLGFFTALALLICGNGFFKPNISTIVGSLYAEGSHKRDGGFTIFYMGVNLGAAMSPLLCGYIGETYGWHYGFGLATIGMLTGIAVFVAPSPVSQVSMFLLAALAAVSIFMFPTGSSLSTSANVVVLVCLAIAGLNAMAELGRGRLKESILSTLIARIVITAGAVTAAAALFWYRPESPFSIGVNVFVGVSLLAAGVVACVALGRGGLPKEAGAPPDPERLRRPLLGPFSAEWLTYLGTAVAIAIFVLLVSGFAPLTPDNRALAVIPDSVIESIQESGGAMMEVVAVVLREMSRPAGLVLMLSGLVAFAYLGFETLRLDKVPRERMFVVLVLTFFSILFWSFFEQAGSSLNNFTDRNVDRVSEARHITDADVGQTIRFRVSLAADDTTLKSLPMLNQEQLGYRNGNDAMKAHIEQAIRSEEKRKGKLKPEEIDDLVRAVTEEDAFTLTGLTYLRAAAARDGAPAELKTIDWAVTDDNLGMGVGGSEIAASIFQSVNPVFILIFGLVLTALWAVLDRWGLEPGTPVKFALGLFQLGLGFGAFWYGAQLADERGMVVLSWLFLGYLFHTTGELCLSPVGLSMVTKLSPARLVSTVMGGWFLATAFSQFLAAIIAQFTGVGHGNNGASTGIPVPKETVNVYGDVFGKIALSAMASALICFALAPLLRRWTHPEADAKETDAHDEP